MQKDIQKLRVYNAIGDQILKILIDKFLFHLLLLTTIAYPRPQIGRIKKNILKGAHQC